jgi:hypothetical protein
MNYETSFEIEIAVAHYFGTTTHVIVPNVSWGMFGYELDLCILNNNSFYASEVEIKISKADLKRDSLKRHNHDRNGNLIKSLWFAMPEKLKNKGCDILVPESAGILYVGKNGNVVQDRKPVPSKFAKKWTYADAFKLARLGTLRTWNLKGKELIALRRKEKDAHTS